jgi:hypothetical protein
MNANVTAIRRGRMQRFRGCAHVLLLFMLGMPAHAQTWTWMSGSTMPYQPDVFGIKGVPSLLNTPGNRSSFAGMMDSHGTLWIYGGTYSDGVAGGGGLRDDLWRCDTKTGQWTWVSGSGTLNTPPHYGIRGQADSLSHPGARYGVTGWCDSSGGVWIFGGQGVTGTSNYMWNDLWRYDSHSGMWTWIGGADTARALGQYGPRGVPSASGWPGARLHHAMVQAPDGAVYLFGGLGYDSLGGAQLNDLWKYDMGSGEWTFLSGCTDCQHEMRPIFGSRGLACDSCGPAPRDRGLMWLRDSILYEYGGRGNGYRGTHLGYYNMGILGDLWSFDLRTQEWTWLGGSDTLDPAPVYGTFGVPDMWNYPGSRYASAGSVDTCGNLWLFAGAVGDGKLGNDTWMYDVSQHLWGWMHGPSAANQFGVYGLKGVPSPSNIPGTRGGHVVLRGSEGAVWLFGGTGRGTNSTGGLNDLWRLTGAWRWPVELTTFSGRCIDGTVTLNWTTASETNGAHYRIERCTPGVDDTWSVRGTVAGAGTTTQARSYSFSEPAPDGARLLRYRLSQRDYDGTEENLGMVDIAVEAAPLTATLSAPYPNPASGRITLQWTLLAASDVTLTVTDMLGREVLRLADGLSLQPGTHTRRADVSSLLPGGYLLSLRAAGRVQTRLLTVAR